MHDFAIVGLHIGMKFTKTSKVDVFEENLGSLIHFRKIEGIEQPPCIVTIERLLASGNIIFIGTIGCIETGMSIRLHLLHIVHCNVMREQTVQFVCYGLSVQFCIEVKMSNHQFGMYTGIGTSGTYHFDILAQKGSKRLHQRFLYTGTIRLNLPTVIIGTVVC